MINQCYKHHVARKHIVNKIGQVLRLEIKAMCSDRVSSILQSMNSDNLKTFRWDLVLSELKCTNADGHPFLLHQNQVPSQKSDWDCVFRCINIV